MSDTEVKTKKEVQVSALTPPIYCSSAAEFAAQVAQNPDAWYTFSASITAEQWGSMNDAIAR